MLDTPHRLTVLTIAGSLLSVAGFLCGSLRSVYASLPLLITCFAGVVIGLVGMYWASYVLREDVRNERWSDETLAPFRRVVDHFLWKVAMAFLVVAMFATLTQDRHHHTWFWAVFFLLQTQTKIANAFVRLRKPPAADTRPDWAKVRPLRSAHWGQP